MGGSTGGSTEGCTVSTGGITGEKADDDNNITVMMTTMTLSLSSLVDPAASCDERVSGLGRQLERRPAALRARRMGWATQ